LNAFNHICGWALQIPFINGAPRLTFKKPIGSVSVSGHKFLGVPVPCGVIITRKVTALALGDDDIEYIKNRDMTISGTRNGQVPVYLWYALSTKGYMGIKKEVEQCIGNAQLLKACPLWLYVYHYTGK
jgi:histidine decarboxylase